MSKIPLEKSKILEYLDENITILKSDKDLLDEIFERDLDEDILNKIARKFILNKFFPTRHLKFFPLGIIDSCIELNFNPGVGGIIDLCEVSLNENIDKGIVRIMDHFQSNKYDAFFTKSVINLMNSKSDLSLTSTVASIYDKSLDKNVIYEEVKKQSNLSVFKMIMVLDLDSGKTLARNMSQSDLNDLRYKMKNDLQFLNFVKVYHPDSYSNTIRGGSFTSLLSSEDTNSQIDDDLASMLLELPPTQNYRFSNPIIYRPVFETLSFETLSKIKNFAEKSRVGFKGVPRSSILFTNSFLLGNSSLEPKEAFDYILNRTSRESVGNRLTSKNELLERILSSGEDSVIAALVKEHSLVFVNYLKDVLEISPNTLKNSIPYGKTATAQVIYDLLGTPYRAALADKFTVTAAESTKKIGPSIRDKHTSLWSSIRSGDVTGFFDKLNDYDKSATTDRKLQSFFTRNDSNAYETEFRSKSVGVNFLSKLEDEELVILFIKNLRTVNYGNQEFEPFLNESAVERVSKLNKVQDSFLFDLAINKKPLLDKFETSSLISLRLNEPYSKITEEIIVKRILDNPNLRLMAGGVDNISKICKKLPKEVAIRVFALKPSTYSSYHKLEFLNDEKFTVEDVRELYSSTIPSAVTSMIRIVSELYTPESRAEVIKICNAVLAKKSDDFKRIFPLCKVRPDDLVKTAIVYLNSYGETKVDIKDLVKQRKNSLIEIKKYLDPIDYIDELLTISTRSLTLDIFGVELTLDEIAKLNEKYKVYSSEDYIVSARDVAIYKTHHQAGIEVRSVNFGTPYKQHEDAIANIFEYFEENRIDYTNSYIFRTERIQEFILDLVKSSGNQAYLKGIRQGKIDAIIKNDSQYKYLDAVISLDVLDPNNAEVAMLVSHNKKRIDVVLEKKFKFNNLVIFLDTWNYENVKVNVPDLKKIGIFAYDKKDANLFHILKELFNSKGEIKDFEAVSLSNLSQNERVSVISKLSEKDPRYKKLLGQDLGGKDFVLVPGDKIGKNLLTIANLKDIIGEGMPSGLTPQEKESLESILNFKGSLIRLGADNLRKFLQSVGFKEVKFWDIFKKKDDLIDVSDLAKFMSSEFARLDLNALHILFSTLLKGASRDEVLAMLVDGERYYFTFIKDSISSIESIRQALNQIFSYLGADDVGAHTVFEAMAGNKSANERLETYLNQDTEESVVLTEVSNLIKNKTVRRPPADVQRMGNGMIMANTDSISNARDRLKNEKSPYFAREIHDILGSMANQTQALAKDKDLAKKLKVKSGLSFLNEGLGVEECFVKPIKGGEFLRIYFPEDLREVREIGNQNAWCTGWTDSYFDRMIRGEAVLFQLKNKEEQIVAQGFVPCVSGKFVTNNGFQLKYPHNQAGEHDFDKEELCALLEKIIKNSKISERYK